MNGLTHRKAATEAGYGPGIIDNPERVPEKVQKSLSELLAKAGATNEKLATRISEGLDANKHLNDGSQVVDYKERREHVRLVAELTGQLQSKGSANIGISLNLTGVMGERFAEFARSLEDEGAIDGTAE